MSEYGVSKSLLRLVASGLCGKDDDLKDHLTRIGKPNADETKARYGLGDVCDLYQCPECGTWWHSDRFLQSTSCDGCLRRRKAVTA